MNLTDQQIIEKCAERMGWTHLGAIGVPFTSNDEMPQGAYWCRSGGNDWWLDHYGYRVCAPCQGIPNPLVDRAEAMAMVERFRLSINLERGTSRWMVGPPPHMYESADADLRRAISLCVAFMEVKP